MAYLIENCGDSNLMFGRECLAPIHSPKGRRLPVDKLTQLMVNLRDAGIIKVIEVGTELDMDSLSPFQRKKALLQQKVKQGHIIVFLN